MIKVLILFIVLIAGIIIGPIVAGHQGYVLIQTNNYDIETSVTGLVICFIILQFIFCLLGLCYRRIRGTSSFTHNWLKGCKYHKTHSQTQKALLKLAEGDFSQVEKLLTGHADYAEQPVVNYPTGRRSRSSTRGDEYRTNQYLERAAEVAGNHQLPVDITRVRIQLAEGKIHAARHGVDKLLDQAPRHPEVLRMAEQAYERSGAYQALIELLPIMQKEKLYSAEEIDKLRKDTYKGLINQYMAEGGSENLKDWWQSQGHKIRHDPVLQSIVAARLIECDDIVKPQKKLLLQA